MGRSALSGLLRSWSEERSRQLTCCEPMRCRCTGRGGRCCLVEGREAGDGVLHEVGVLLGEGWVYCMGVGGSCSMDNPWPVDPDPRGVGPGRQVAGSVLTSSQGRRLPTLVECGFPGRVRNHRCANATSIHRADRSG